MDPGSEPKMSVQRWHDTLSPDTLHALEAAEAKNARMTQQGHSVFLRPTNQYDFPLLCFLVYSQEAVAAQDCKNLLRLTQTAHRRNGDTRLAQSFDRAVRFMLEAASDPESSWTDPLGNRVSLFDVATRAGNVEAQQILKRRIGISPQGTASSEGSDDAEMGLDDWVFVGGLRDS